MYIIDNGNINPIPTSHQKSFMYPFIENRSFPAQCIDSTEVHFVHSVHFVLSVRCLAQRLSACSACLIYLSAVSCLVSSGNLLATCIINSLYSFCNKAFSFCISATLNSILITLTNMFQKIHHNTTEY